MGSKVKINKPLSFDSDVVESSNIALRNSVKIANEIMYFSKKLNESTLAVSYGTRKSAENVIKEKARKINDKFINNVVRSNFIEKIATRLPEIQDYSYSSIKEMNKNINRAAEGIGKISTGDQLQERTVELLKDIRKVYSVQYEANAKYQTASHQELFDGIKRLNDIYKNGGKVLSYDLETLGGTNNAGHNQVDFITEVGYTVRDMYGINNIEKPNIKDFKNKADYESALKKYHKTINNINNISAETRAYSTLIGVTESEREDLIKLVKSFAGREDDSIAQVYIKRLSMLANEGLELEKKKGRFEVSIKNTGETGEVSIEKALKGIEKLREVGKHQESVIDTDLILYRNELLNNIQELVLTGKNDAIDLDLTKNGIIMGHNIDDFDSKAFSQVTGKRYEKNKEVILDTLQVAKNIDNNKGRGAAVPKGLKVSNEFGYNTQDSIVYGMGLVKEGKETHNALIDAENRLVSMFTKTNKMQKTLLDHMTDQMYSIEKDKEGFKSTHEFTGRQAVFMSTKSGSTVNGDKNILSFAHYKDQGKLKFSNGTIINKNGEIVKDHAEQFFMKKNSLYTFEQFEVGVNSEEMNNLLKELSEGENEYFKKYKGAEKLYIQKATEWTPDANNVNRPVFYNVSMEQFDNWNEVTKIGYLNKDGTLSEYMTDVKGSRIGVSEKLDVGRAIQQEDGTFRFAKSDNVIGDLVENTKANSKDSVSRKLRGGNPKLLRGYAFNKNNNGLSQAEYVSKLVSENKLGELDQETALKQMQDLLGFTWNKERYIALSEYGNLQYEDNFIKAVTPLIDGFVDEGLLNMDDLFSSNNYDGTIIPKYIQGKKRVRTEEIMTGIYDEIVKEVSENSDSFKHVIKDQAMTKKDFMVIDILKNDIRRDKRYRIGAENANDFYTINLTSENSLLKTFFNARYKDIKYADMNGMEGYSALVDAYKYFSNDERFSEALIGLNKRSFYGAYEKGMNVKKMAADLQTALLRSLESGENIADGIKYRRKAIDMVSKEATDEINAWLSNKENTSKIIERVKGRLASNQIADEGYNNVNMLAEAIYGHIMYKDNVLENQIKDMPKAFRDVVLNQHALAKRDAQDKAQDIAKAILETGERAYISEDGIIMKANDEFLKLNTYRYAVENGQIFTVVGKDKYNFKAAVDVRGHLQNSKNTYKPISKASVKASSKNEVIRKERMSIEGKVRAAMSKNGGERDPLTAISNALANLDNDVREHLSRIGNHNYAEKVANNFYLDFEDIFKVLPDLQMSGDLDKMLAVSKAAPNNKNHSAIINRFIEDIKEKISKNGRMSVDDIQTTEMTAFYRSYLDGLMDYLQDALGGETEVELNGTKYSIDGIGSKINLRTKSTNIEKKLFSLVEETSKNPFSKVENHQRDPIYQGSSAAMYDKAQMKSKLKDAKKSYENAYVKVDNVVGTTMDEFFMSGDKKAGEGLTLKTLNANNDAITGILINDIEDARNGGINNVFYLTAAREYPTYSTDDLKIIAKANAEKAMQISTFEQQTFTDSRIASAAFSRGNVKTIKGSYEMKDAIFDSTTGEPLSNQIMPIIDDSGNIHYRRSKVVDKRQTVGLFGEGDVKKTSRNEGLIEARFYNKTSGLEIAEKELNVEISRILNEKGIQAKNINEETREMIFRELQGIYDFNYKIHDTIGSSSFKLMTNATEKSTTISLLTGIGNADKTLVEEINNLDLGLKVKKGTVYSEKFYDELKNRIMDGTSQREARDLITRIDRERHLLSSSIFSMDFFSKNGITQISNYNIEKHITTSAAIQDVVDRASNVLDQKEFKEFIKTAFDMEKSPMLNNKVMVDDLKSVSFSSNEIKNFLGTLSEEKQKEMDFIINHGKQIDINGNYVDGTSADAVGHIQHARATQLIDDEGGISSGFESVNKVQKELGAVNKEIEKAQNKLNSLLEDGVNSDSEEAKDLINFINGQDRYANELSNKIERLQLDKGLKFTERMNVNLSKERHNAGTYKTLQENMSSSEFGRSMYHEAFGKFLNDDGTIKSQYEGQSILEGILTDIRKDKMLLGHGETPLEDAIKLNPEKYGYLKNSVDIDHSKISVEKAEMLYSLKKGEEALKYNNLDGYDDKLINELTSIEGDNGWKLVDLSKGEKIDIDIGGQGDIAITGANNPYTNNLIIKTGLGGENEYVFTGRMPEKHFEDSIIKKNSVRQISTIQNNSIELNKAMEASDIDAVQKYTSKLIDSIDQYKDYQKADISSKTGLAGRVMETRLGMTFSGKGSGMTIVRDKAGNIISNPLLDKAQFMGASLSTHYSNNSIVNAAWISEQAFEELGYFDEGRMKNLFQNMDNSEMMRTAFGTEYFDIDEMSYDEVKAGMMNILEKYGDASINTRFPNIQESSDKISMVYLNRDLAKNQIQTIGHTNMSMKGDFDGDSFFAAIVNKAPDGEVNTYLTQLAMEGDKSVVDEVNASVTMWANTTGRFWNRKVGETEEKMGKISVGGVNFETIANKRTIDGKLMPRVSHDTFRNNEELHDAVVKFANSYDGRGAEILDIAMKKGPTETINELIDGGFLSDADEISNFKEDFTKAFFGRVYMDEQVAKTSKGSIGQTNVTAFKTRAMGLLAADRKAVDYDYKAGNIVDMLYQAEEAIISSKSAVDTLSRADRASTWNAAIDSILKGESNVSENELRGQMVQWLNDNVKGTMDFGQHFERSSTFKDMARSVVGEGSDKQVLSVLKEGGKEADELFDIMANDLVDSIFQAGKNPNSAAIYESMRAGMSTNGVIKAFEDLSFMQGTIGETIGEAYNNINTESAINLTARIEDISAMGSNNSKNIYTKIGDSQQSGAGVKKAINGIIDGAEDIIKSSLPKSGLAMGALGLAAGVLISGFVGGRPRPADTHAMEEANNQHAPMDGHMVLSDPVAQQGGRGGYVVNINARSKGDKKNVSQAIQQAISSGMGANVNVTMNIGNDYSNISNRDIETAVMAALE